jgi:hypothetical protein
MGSQTSARPILISFREFSYATNCRVLNVSLLMGLCKITQDGLISYPLDRRLADVRVAVGLRNNCKDALIADLIDRPPSNGRV